MRFTLRQVEVFLAVARFESVSRAGEALHMSQSAVSGALLELERQFDVRLFERIGKRLRLSDRGKALRPQAQATLDRAQELEAGLSSLEHVGPLRVGATMTIGDHLAIPLLARFLRTGEGPRPSLIVANTQEIVRLVANFEIDVGLIEGDVHHPELSVSRWRDDELVVFCSPSHPYADKRRLGDADLLAAAWVVREQGSGTRQAFDRAMHGLSLDILLELQHTEALRAAVEEGLGLGCLSVLAVADQVAQGKLVRCSVPHRDLRRHFSFLLHKEKFRSASIERLIALARDL